MEILSQITCASSHHLQCTNKMTNESNGINYKYIVAWPMMLKASSQHPGVNIQLNIYSLHMAINGIRLLKHRHWQNSFQSLWVCYGFFQNTVKTANYNAYAYMHVCELTYRSLVCKLLDVKDNAKIPQNNPGMHDINTPL